MELLLDNGANVNTEGGEYGNALQAASYKGKQEVMQLLLDNRGLSTRSAAFMAMLYMLPDA